MTQGSRDDDGAWVDVLRVVRDDARGLAGTPTELDAGVEAGWGTAEQAGVIHQISEQARREQIDPGAWPLDEGWEDW